MGLSWQGFVPDRLLVIWEGWTSTLKNHWSLRFERKHDGLFQINTQTLSASHQDKESRWKDTLQLDGDGGDTGQYVHKDLHWHKP